MKKITYYIFAFLYIVIPSFAQLGMGIDDLKSKWGEAIVVNESYPYNYLSERCWDRSVSKESEYGYKVLGWNKNEYFVRAIIHPSRKCIGLRISRIDKKSISKSAAYKLRDQLLPKQKFVIDKMRTRQSDNQAKQTGDLHTSGWVREFAIANNKYISTYSYQVDKEGKTISPAIVQIDDLYPDSNDNINQDTLLQATLRHIEVSQIVADGILALARKPMLLVNIPNKDIYAEGDIIVGMFVEDGVYKYTSVLGAEKSILKIKWIDYPPLPHVKDARQALRNRVK